MSAQQESPAVAIARAHVEAWSNHDFDTARSMLAHDVKVTATPADPALPQTDLTGAGNYMAGLIAYAQPIVPGSVRILASTGDERNALLALTMTMAGGPFGTGATAPCARLYVLDDNDKIKIEHVIFYVAPSSPQPA
jgi:SnoaL-like protein